MFVQDRQGVIHTAGRDLNPNRWGVAADTSKRTLAEAIRGADVFIGVSGPDLVMATGRSDYPNQVNNAFGFRFIFRGALSIDDHSPRGRTREWPLWSTIGKLMA